MPKKVSITLSDGVYTELEALATQQGRTPTGLAAFLVEFCLVSRQGLAGVQQQPLPLAPTEAPDGAEILAEFIQALASGSKPSNAVLLATASLVGVDLQRLHQLVTRRNGDDDRQKNRPVNSC